MSGVHISEILDVKLLNEHVKNGLVGVQRHPTLQLSIYNYTHRAQYDGTWGDGTIDLCRGLIVDDSGIVIARPFKKFHNLNTASIPETLEANLPDVLPTITDKLDGSLGIFWQYGTVRGIATRGSFTSPQAQWATKWFTDKVNAGEAVWPFDTSYTVVAEIIYAENRIVCKYNQDELLVLALIDNATGYEYPYSAVEVVAAVMGLKQVERFPFMSLAECVAENEKNKEGYVLTYHTDVDKPPVKVKVKFADYVRLHRLVTGVSPKAVWELASSGASIDQFIDTPTHFKDWVWKVWEELTGRYKDIYNEARMVFNNRPLQSGDYLDPRAYRKRCAEYFKEKAPKIQGVLFSMLDNNPVSPVIWKMIKPVAGDEAFRKDGE